MHKIEETSSYVAKYLAGINMMLHTKWNVVQLLDYSIGENMIDLCKQKNNVYSVVNIGAPQLQ